MLRNRRYEQLIFSRSTRRDTSCRFSEERLGLLASRAIGAVFAEVGFVKAERYKTSFAAVDSFLSEQGLQFSGFYQMFRWGPQKRWTGFANGLWLLN